MLFRSGTIKRGDGGHKYYIIGINRKTYRAHRIAWKLMYNDDPIELIDHIDGNGLNNAIGNLRIANDHLNGANSKISKNNKSGFKGVCWDKAKKKWLAQITVKRKKIHIGRYDKAEDAHHAYCEAAKKHFGEYARLK